MPSTALPSDAVGTAIRRSRPRKHPLKQRTAILLPLAGTLAGTIIGGLLSFYTNREVSEHDAIRQIRISSYEEWANGQATLMNAERFSDEAKRNILQAVAAKDKDEEVYWRSQLRIRNLNVDSSNTVIRQALTKIAVFAPDDVTKPLALWISQHRPEPCIDMVAGDLEGWQALRTATLGKQEGGTTKADLAMLILGCRLHDVQTAEKH